MARFGLEKPDPPEQYFFMGDSISEAFSDNVMSVLGRQGFARRMLESRENNAMARVALETPERNRLTFGGAYMIDSLGFVPDLHIRALPVVSEREVNHMLTGSNSKYKQGNPRRPPVPPEPRRNVFRAKRKL